jgi:hypothetical protein
MNSTSSVRFAIVFITHLFTFFHLTIDSTRTHGTTSSNHLTYSQASATLEFFFPVNT